MADQMYKIVRFYRDFDNPKHGSIVEKGLTLEEAQAHCKDESSHELDGDGSAIWFDGYSEEEE